LIAGSVRQLWALWHQTGVQYSTVEWNRARVAICSVVAPVPSQTQQTTSWVWRWCIMSASCEVTQGVSDTWATCLTLLQGIWVWSRRTGFCCCGWLLAQVLLSLLLRWKTANTIFVVLSLSFQTGGIHLWLPYPCLALHGPRKPL